MHELERVGLRGFLYIELLVDFVGDVHHGPIDENLLEEIVFELATAHEEPLQDQTEAFSAVRPMKIRLEGPIEGMAHHSRILQSLFE